MEKKFFFFDIYVRIVGASKSKDTWQTFKSFVANVLDGCYKRRRRDISVCRKYHFLLCVVGKKKSLIYTYKVNK